MNENISVEEARQLKLMTEEAITDSLNSFSKKTGMRIDYVEVDTYGTLDGSVSYIVKLDVKL